MPLLLLVSFIWAFSFGLIGHRLAGIDPTAVAVLRLALALLVFLPFFRRGNLTGAAMVRLALIGAVQFGGTYLLYLRAYRYLQSFEVALFTITTPLCLALLDAALERRWRPAHAVAALFSVAGAAVVVWKSPLTHDFALGCALVQGSNLCFAAGQLAWRRERGSLRGGAGGDASVFALPYAGALILALAWSAATTAWSSLRLSTSQMATIAYLGILASGLCFFWWNRAARSVNAGVLAVLNNAKIPLGVACSLLFFGEKSPLLQLAIGIALMGAGAWLATERPAKRPGTEGG